MKFLSLLTTTLALGFGIGAARADSGTFTNSAGISIQDTAAPTAASPYPSTINVSGLSGIISKVTVKYTGLTHGYPSDIDMMLVAPDGTRAVIFSDAGGKFPVSNLTVTLDDGAASSLPNDSAIASGSYRPTNYSTGDTFPAPAPSTPAAVLLSTFNGLNPSGVWSLYVVDDSISDSGSIGSWSLTITTAQPIQPGQLVISEFRLRGTNGANDEFVEVHNATDSALTVQGVDGSSGYALAASDGVARFVIPNGTVIPARGHFLGVNSGGYSLASHPAGNGTTATGDATWTTDIPDNAGLALFRTSVAANFTLANRLDAVGSTSEANTLYKEGTGYGALSSFAIDSSFYRELLATGAVRDSGNNSKDFVFVDTNGTSAGAGQRLGAPGPENLSSPGRLLTGPPLLRQLVDPGAAFNAAPNRSRDFTSDPANNGIFGSIQFSRKFVNATGGNLTRLRFRVIDLNTFPSPSNVADLRPRSSSNSTVTLSAGGSVTIGGTTLEQPPSQPNGGGFNSTFTAGTVTLASPLANGASINLRFLFGIQQTGSFRIALLPETLPLASSGIWVISGQTDSAAVEVETVPLSSILSVTRAAPNANLTYQCALGIPFQLQSSTDLSTWTDLGSTIAGSGQTENYTHSNGGILGKRFYRLQQVP